MDVHSQKDRFGQSLHEMVLQLRQTIANIKQASHRVNNGTDVISTTSNSLSNDATNQAASLEEISSSTTEITEQIRQNAEGAERANQLTSETTGAFEQGVQKMQIRGIPPPSDWAMR